MRTSSRGQNAGTLFRDKNEGAYTVPVHKQRGRRKKCPIDRYLAQLSYEGRRGKQGMGKKNTEKNCGKGINK